MIFETRRLRVCPLAETDLDWLAKLEGDPRVMRYTDRPPQTREQTRQALAELAGHKDLDGRLCLWAAHNQEGEAIGTVAVYHNEEKQWEMGYKFFPECWGRGLGREVATGLVNYLKSELAGETLNAYVYSDNQGSWKILEQIGFELQREWFNEEAGLMDRHYSLTLN